MTAKKREQPAPAKPPRWTEYVALDEVLRAPRNPKNHNAQVIAGSMKRFGVVELPAIDERTGRLVAGHGRLADWEARRDAGQPPPEGVMEDPANGWMVPLSRGWASKSDAEAEAYLITSNNSVIMGGWDEAALNTVLADIARDDFGLAQVTGTSAAQLEGILDAQEQGLKDMLAAASTAESEEAQYHPQAYADPATEAPWMAQTAPRYDGDGDVIEHDQVPATGARYAESDEQQAERAARIAGYQPRTDANGGMVEMILVYPVDDRNEIARLVSAAREVLGRDMKSSEVLLRAVRTLVAVLDNRNAPEPIEMSIFAGAAGWVDDGTG
jgi:hypothetical protein